MPKITPEKKLLRELATRTTPLTAYGYARVSHNKSFDKGDSLPAQEDRINTYYQQHLKPHGIVLGSIRNDGQSVSAYRVPFFIRPAGKLIMNELKAGDHLIIDKPDRIWRSMDDFVHVMESLKKLGVTVHIVDFLGQTIKNNTPMGEFCLNMLVMVAQLESSIKSQRIKEGVAVAIKKGKSPRKYIAGCYWDENGDLQWNRKERAVAAYIMKIKNPTHPRYGGSQPEWCNLFNAIEAYEAEVYGRPIRTIAEQQKDRKYRWRQLYRNERAFQYLGITHPSQLPNEDGMQEAKRQWERERVEKRACKTSRQFNEKKYGRQCYSVVEKITADQLLSLK